MKNEEDLIVKKLTPIGWFIGRTGIYLIAYLILSTWFSPDISNQSLGTLSLSQLVGALVYYGVVGWLIVLYIKGFNEYEDTKEIWSPIGGLLIVGILGFGVYLWYDAKPISTTQLETTQNLIPSNLPTQKSPQSYTEITKVYIYPTWESSEGKVWNFNLNIPTSTRSMCTWNYSNINNVPYSEMTTSVRMHTLVGVDSRSHNVINVTCTDESGDKYEGVF